MRARFSHPSFRPFHAITPALFACALAFGVAATGCGGRSEDSATGGSSANPLAPESDVFVGAWQGGSVFRGIVFARSADGARFFADVAPDARCIGCPKDLRISGTYEVVPGGIRLTADLDPFADDAEVVRESIRTYWSGRFTTHLDGTRLSFSRSEPIDSLERATSYCSLVVDCESQGIARDACEGELTCSSNACAFACGTAATPPADPPVTEPPVTEPGSPTL